MTRSAAPPTPDERTPVGRRLSWTSVRAALQLLQVRLRLPIVLILAAIVVGQWDLIRNYWGRLTRVIYPDSIALQAVSSDTEYFCPMDPGIISDWPSKCGVCNMTLVRRKRGEAVSLPDGVVARMQLSPNRIQLAGIQTAPVVIPAACNRIRTRDPGDDRARGPDRGCRDPAPARGLDFRGPNGRAGVSRPAGTGRTDRGVRRVASETAGGWAHLRAVIEFLAPSAEVRAGMPVIARFKTPVSATEPFRSMPADPPALSASELRRVYVCPDHTETVALEPGNCPIDENARVAVPLEGHQRIRFWCPMHPAVTADHAGEKCAACGGMTLLPRVVSYRPAGQVLAVPRSAVIDGGAKRVVFVESMPGMFDGIEVVLGPRCGEFYPVVRGLEAGQKVAGAGAFLLDAETRLNPSLAAAYFGAGRGEHHSPASPAAVTTRKAEATDLVACGPGDGRPHAGRRQKICPVTNRPLGSMGTPTRLLAKGKVVFLCCDGCENKFNGDPEKYLARLAEH